MPLLPVPMIRRILRLFVVLPWFLAVYARDLVLSNLRIALEVLTPRDGTRPGFVEVEVEAASDGVILAYCNLLTMTPGTLAVDVSPDRRIVTVHAMYLDDPDEFRRGLKRSLESHLRRLSS